MQLHIEETKVPTMSLEDLVELRDMAQYQMDEIKATITVVNQEIIDRLKKKKLNGTVVNDKTVTIVKRVSFKIDIETAQALGATKEAVDNAKLKTLYNKGVDIPGTSVSEFIMVRDIKKDDK